MYANRSVVQALFVGVVLSLTTGLGVRGSAATVAGPMYGTDRSPEASSGTGTVRILAYTQYSDNGQGDEYENTVQAIRSVGTDFTIDALSDFRQLDSVLPGHDVLLIPEQENADAAVLDGIGRSWAATVQGFVVNGGVVVQCDFAGRYMILTGAGLMHITEGRSCTRRTANVAVPNDPLVAGVPNSFTLANGSSCYSTSETVAVVRLDTGEPVVIHKEMGLGSVVLIGHDFYESNAAQDRIVGNAVFNILQTRDNLEIRPWQSFESSGPQAGPFTPGSQAYCLTNTSTGTVNWTAGNSAPWLDLSPTSGTLAPGTSATLVATINAHAHSLPYGGHSDTIVITNGASGIEHRRNVVLQVRRTAAVPFAEGFESGSLASYWESTGTNEFRNRVTSSYWPHTGSYHLVMDDNVSGGYSRNELTLTINLANLENVVLSFWMKEFNDQDHGPPPSPFTDGADFDGVAISEDGVAWYEVQGLRQADGISNSYREFTVDLDAAITAHQLSYNSAFRIRFNHFDDYPIATDDGFAFDDIEVTGEMADDLQVVPAAGFAAIGPEGGPFNPNGGTYVLINRGSASLDWTARSTVNWLNLSKTTGTLAAGASDAVQVSFNAAASSLPGGIHVGSVVMTNVTNGVKQVRRVELDVHQIASIPFLDGFETGRLEAYWRSTGTNQYHTRVDTGYGPHAGNYHLIMDADSSAGQYSRNELTLTIDLANYENVVLSFWMKESSDEDHGPPPVPFTGGADFDGVAISADGHAWYEVQGLRAANGISNSYREFTVDLDAAVATHGLAYNSTFRIRFNHYDDRQMTTDGFAFDEIKITGDVADDLTVTPRTPFESIGPEGGPFSPASKTYRLGNSGSSPLDWAAVASADWLGVSPAGGTLAPGATDTLKLSLNTLAKSLSRGTHHTTVTLTNATTGRTRRLEVALLIRYVPTVPFFEGFESGSLAEYWESTGTYDFRTRVISSYGPHGGAYHLVMDDSTDGGYSRNEVTLIIDLAHHENVVLKFWMKEYSDADHGPPPSPFIGGADFDGVAVSEDGVTWYEVQGLRSADGVCNSWREFVVDLDAAIDRFGLSYTPGFRIRFNHYDDYPIRIDDGFAFDDIEITGEVADDLGILPKTGITFVGAEGGPFYPGAETYALTNTGSASLDWTAGKDEDWLDLSQTGGTLAPGTSTTVLVLVNSQAGATTPGLHTATVAFTNVDSGVVQRLTFGLHVLHVAGVPFYEGFEEGILEPYWRSTGTNQFRTQITTAYQPHGGSRHLTMDSSYSGAYSRNELTLDIDLANYKNLALSFWMKEFSDDNHGPPPEPFMGGADFDGVAISQDGATWYEVQGLRSGDGISNAYKLFTVDLDGEIDRFRLSCESPFHIRFNQYDDCPIESDGFAFDDIEITGVPKGDLQVTPLRGFEAYGTEGGPFSPTSRRYEVTNRGLAPLDWTVSKSVGWLGLDKTGGTLAPGDSDTVTVSLNGGSTTLPAGRHTGKIVFNWSATEGPITIQVTLTTEPAPQPNLTITTADAGPEAPIMMRPGNALVLSAFIENTETAWASPFWVEVWGSRTGGLTLDRFLAPSLKLGAGLFGRETHSWATTAPLYGIPDGPYTVVYAVDRPGDVSEVNERDNRCVVAGKQLLIIRPQTQADLVVEGFGFDINPAQSGQQVVFTGQVVNRGAEASGPFWIEFWGSWDWPFPTLGFFLCDSIPVADLAPGATVDLSAWPRQLYDVPAGAFMIGCFADRDDQINELDETNNYQFLDGQVFNRPTLTSRHPVERAAAGPDIAIVSADFSPWAPVRVAPGDTITPTVEVANRGNSHTGSFWLEYWGSRNGGLTFDDFLCDSDPVADIPPGETIRLSSPKTLYSIPDGPYTALIVADRPGEVGETDVVNNRLAVAGKRLLTIRPPTDANLVLESFDLRWSSSSWPAMTLSGRVRNTGTVAGGPFWIEFWLSRGDSDYPRPDLYAADSIWVNRLGPGESIDLSRHSRAMYTNVPPGPYAVIGFVDRLDQVAETEESDNYAIVRNRIVPQH